MRTCSRSASPRFAHLVYLTLLSYGLCGATGTLLLRGDAPAKGDKTKDDTGTFFSVVGAKDCAFDSSRHRLYVTTGKQLVIVDTRDRKILESIDLVGNVQGCDVSPDFKFLAVAPAAAQFVYKVPLGWTKVEDMEIRQVKFRGDDRETGVFSLCVGFDGSVLFSTTYNGSGWVKLRRLAPNDAVAEVGRVRMDTVLAASGDRHFAAVAEGNISSGPLSLFDFKQQSLQPVKKLNDFHYEMSCSREAKFFARPHRKGCDLYDSAGGRLGSLDGAPVISAAFHSKTDALFVMRHGEVNIQEYDVQGKKVSNNYPLDRPLMIKGDVRSTVVADLQPVGRDVVIATFRRITNVNFKMYQSGRLKVSDDGESLCAVVPTGVYLFPLKQRAAPEVDPKPKPKIKVIDPK